jgi:hypothetical protein
MASLAVGALLLALAASATPLFISKQTSELVAAEVGNPTLTRYGAGILYETSELDYDTTAPGETGQPLFRRQNEVFAERVSSSPYFGPIVNTVLGPQVGVGGPDAELGEDPGRLIARTDALAHVEKLRGTDGDGVWITQFVADHLAVEPGDELTLRAGTGEVRVRVDGIYSALNEEPRTGYWRSLSREIYPVCNDCAAPPPFVIADYDQVIQIAKALGVPRGDFVREAPLAPNSEFTVNDIRDVEQFAADFREDMAGQGIEGVAQCCFRGINRFDVDGYESNFITFIPQVVNEVESRVATIEGPVQLLLVAGIMVAAVVIAAAGAFAVATRKVEATLLYARGQSPLMIAVKACLEALIPCLIGSALGFGVALLVVRGFGPSGPIDDAAVASAARAAAFAVPVSVALLGAVSAVAFLRQSEHHSTRFGYLARIPWEIALLLLALWFWLRLDSGGALVHDEALDVNRPSIYLLLFPLTLVAGFAIVGARVFRAALAGLRERSGGYRPSGYLTVHRLAGAGGLTILLFAASALCLGTFVHAETIVGSLEETVDAKAKVFVGSDVQATFDPDYEPPEDFPMPVTKAARLPTAGTIEPGGARFDLLAVDPDTLADAAYWNPAFGADSLSELARAVEDDGNGPVEIIASGGHLPTDLNLSISGEVFPAHVAAETESFPGTSSELLMVVMDQGSIDRVFGAATPLESARSTTEFWVKGDTRAGLNAISTLDEEPYTVLTAAVVKDIPSIAAVIDTFGVLNTLGLAAGLLVIVVMLMYLQARQRSSVVSYALSRRMGLRDRSYRRALVLELSALLVLSYLLGVVLALGAAFAISGMVDPLETIPPEPLFVVPLAGIPVALVVLLAVSVTGGWFTNRRARQTNFAEVMRLAD